MRLSSLIASSAIAVALLAGCGAKEPGFQLVDISRSSFGGRIELTDHNGKPRTLADFRGKVVTVFFGFTHCPDVCPTALAEMAQVVKMLGPDAARVQALFVTVDPERDTEAVLRSYVPAFHPTFLGLRGDAEATARVAKEFKVFHQKQPLKGGGYSVDHSAGTFILDREGRLRLYAQYGQGAAPIVHDIRLLLGGA